MSNNDNSENEDSSEASGGHNVTSFNQRGGITAGELSVGPQQRSLSSKHKEELLDNLGEEDHIIVEAAMNDREAFQLAQEIKSFLESEGFDSVEGIHQVMMAKPVQGVTVITDPDEADYRIHVGSQ